MNSPKKQIKMILGEFVFALKFEPQLLESGH